MQRTPACSCGGSCPRCQAATHAAPRIGEPHDRFEQEADRVARVVMRMPAAPEPPADEEDEWDAEAGSIHLMRRPDPTVPLGTVSDGAATAAQASAIRAALDEPARPLDPALRVDLESRLGRDLGPVRLHAGARAAESARAVQALAYTTGAHIVFGEGRLAPHTAAGRQLLVHELVHVVQQRAAPRLPGRAAAGTEIAAADPAVRLQRQGAPTTVPGSTPTTVPGSTPTCPDAGSISQETDDLPPIPPYMPAFVPGTQMLDLVNGMIDVMRRFEPNRRRETLAPLGFTIPLLPVLVPAVAVPPVRVQAVADGDGGCTRCTADWPIFRPPMVVAIATGYVVSDQRRWVYQPGSGSSCTTGAMGQLKEVRNVITPASLPYTVFAEFEHWSDAMVSFDLTGGRLLANVARLTPERTHLRGRDRNECEQKVAAFLAIAAGRPDALAQIGTVSFLREGYTAVFVRDFLDVFGASAARRDVAGAHRGAVTHPPLGSRPVEPNIDTDVNPFGCTAYARFYRADCCAGIPGESTLDVIEDRSAEGIGPARLPWHVY